MINTEIKSSSDGQWASCGKRGTG